MYQKLNLHFKNLDISRLKGDPQHKYGNPQTKYSTFSLPDWEYFLSLHSGKIKFDIRPHYAYYAEVKGDHYLYPHIDPGSTISLNYYITSANATTSFYKEKENLKYLTTTEELDENNSHMVVKAYNDFSKLDQIGYFTPLPGEAYLMRVDVLHAVSQPEGVRSILTWRWHTHTFEEILESIHIL